MIWSHAGGAMPYLAGRTAVLSQRNKNFRLSGDKLVPGDARFYYDVTQSLSAPTFAALRALVPLEHILFGSDCPFAREPQVRAVLADLDRLKLPVLNARDRTRQRARAVSALRVGYADTDEICPGVAALMKLGFFTMPVHPPGRNYAQTLKEDREAFILADRLGYTEGYCGEHLTDAVENIPNSLMFIATLLDATKQMKVGTAVATCRTAIRRSSPPTPR